MFTTCAPFAGFGGDTTSSSSVPATTSKYRNYILYVLLRCMLALDPLKLAPNSTVLCTCINALTQGLEQIALVHICLYRCKNAWPYYGWIAILMERANQSFPQALQQLLSTVC